jgi:hypothetical protein
VAANSGGCQRDDWTSLELRFGQLRKPKVEDTWMTAKERRQLIETPIVINVVGSQATWGGSRTWHRTHYARDSSTPMFRDAYTVRALRHRFANGEQMSPIELFGAE